MKNIDCYQIREGLRDIKQIPFSELARLGEDKMQYLFHTDFIIACARNKKLIDEHIAFLEEIKKPSKEFEVYQEERREIAKEYSKKDENGNPAIVVRNLPDGSYSESYIIASINDMSTPYNKAIIALDKKYDAEIKEQKAKESQFEKVVFDPCDIKFHMIRESILPTKGLSLLSAEVLLFMLENDPVESESSKKV